MVQWSDSPGNCDDGLLSTIIFVMGLVRSDNNRATSTQDSYYSLNMGAKPHPGEDPRIHSKGKGSWVLFTKEVTEVHYFVKSSQKGGGWGTPWMVNPPPPPPPPDLSMHLQV